MRGSGARAVWWLSVILAVMVAGGGLHPDDSSDSVSRPAFTLFVVDQRGEREAVAHFNRGLWTSTCGPVAPWSPPVVLERPSPVRAIEGSPGAPLYQVRLLTGDPERFYRARDAVQLLTEGQADVPGRVRETLVYAPVGNDSGAVYVDLVVRTPAWSGVQASGWVQPEPSGRLAVVAPRVTGFATYSDFMTVPRMHPLGVADVGVPGGRTWVMQTRMEATSDIQLFDIHPAGVVTGPRMPRGGC